MTVSEIIDLAAKLIRNNDVLYTYHPEYISLSARVAFWGMEQNDTIAIDIQYSAYAYVGEIERLRLPKLFENYIDYVRCPEKYELRREE